MKSVAIYVDSVTLGNPGIGAWTSMLVYGSQRKIMSGTSNKTTRAEMNLVSVIESLEALKEPCIIELYIKYSNACKLMQSGRIENKAITGFKSMSNKRLWEKLYELYSYHKIYVYISTNKEINECTDNANRLAQMALDNLRNNCEGEFATEGEAYKFAADNSLEVISCVETEYGVRIKYRVHINVGVEGKSQTAIPEMIAQIEQPKNYMVGTHADCGMMFTREGGITFRGADAKKMTKTDATKKAAAMTRASKRGYRWIPIKIK